MIVLEAAMEVGESLAYDGALYVRDPRIVDVGCEVSWRILRLARQRRARRLRAAAEDAFATVLDGAKRSNNSLSLTIVELSRKHAVDGSSVRRALPPDVVDQLESRNLPVDEMFAEDLFASSEREHLFRDLSGLTGAAFSRSSEALACGRARSRSTP
jgi:hypothetical protein